MAQQVSVWVSIVLPYDTIAVELKVRADLDFLSDKVSGGSADDKNITELSQPEMSITWIKVKIQCSFRTLFVF